MACGGQGLDIMACLQNLGYTMQAKQIERYRRLLFLTVLEAAKNVACTATRPEGVSERAWNRWEKGESVMPQEVADNLVALIGERQRIVSELADKRPAVWQIPPADTRQQRRLLSSVAAEAAAMGIAVQEAEE